MGSNRVGFELAGGVKPMYALRGIVCSAAHGHESRWRGCWTVAQPTD